LVGQNKVSGGSGVIGEYNNGSQLVVRHNTVVRMLVGSASHYFGIEGMGIATSLSSSRLNIGGSTSTQPHMRFNVGSDKSSPSNGDFWYNSTNLLFRRGTDSIDLLDRSLFTGSGTGQTIYGGANAGVHLYLISTSNSTKGKVYLGSNLFYSKASGQLTFPGLSNYITASGGATTLNGGTQLRLSCGEEKIRIVSTGIRANCPITQSGTSAGFVSGFDLLASTTALASNCLIL
jgi:hypothetical protein